MLSVTGDVKKPILLEASLHNYTLQNLIDEIGAQDIFAAEVGGCTEPIIFKEAFGKKFGFGQGVLNAVGSCVLFDSKRDIAEIYENKLHFMAEESCKQCVPCREGSMMFLEGFHKMMSGKSKINKQSILAAAESAGQTSICAHGKALQPLITEAYNYIQNHPVNHK